MVINLKKKQMQQTGIYSVYRLIVCLNHNSYKYNKLNTKNNYSCYVYTIKSKLKIVCMDVRERGIVRERDK